MKRLKSWIKKRAHQWDMPSTSAQQQHHQSRNTPSATLGSAQKASRQQQQQQQQTPPSELRGYDPTPTFSYGSYTGSFNALLATAVAQSAADASAAPAAVAAVAAVAAAAAAPGGGVVKPWSNFKLDVGPIMACFESV